MKGIRRITRFAGAIAFVIACFLGAPVMAAETAVGSAASIIPNANGNFSESALGDAGADAVRDRAGSEIAVVFSGDLGDYLPSGDITMTDIVGSFPRDSQYYSMSISPAELKSVLEYGVAALSLTEEETLDTKRSESDCFPQVSGITFRVDASAPVGERILSVQLVDGEELDLTSTERILSVALPEQALDWVRGTDISILGGIRDIFLSYLKNETPLERPALDRIHILGAHANPLLASGPVILIGIIILICVVMAIPSTLQKKRNPEAREETYLPGLKSLRNK